MPLLQNFGNWFYTFELKTFNLKNLTHLNFLNGTK